MTGPRFEQLQKIIAKKDAERGRPLPAREKLQNLERALKEIDMTIDERADKLSKEVRAFVASWGSHSIEEPTLSLIIGNLNGFASWLYSAGWTPPTDER